MTITDTVSLPLPITVYSKPGCVQCTAVKRYLKQHSIAFQEFDVSENERALEIVKELGFLQVPVVVVPFGQGVEEPFYGFDPLKLAQIQR